MKIIDINCDLGEGCDNDESLMPFISSANIACGYHAGDPQTMINTIKSCKKYDVAVGAHPSFPDRENFGRNDMHLPYDEIYKLITDQLHAINNLAEKESISLHHVKPHGALYNMAAHDAKLAALIALAVKDFDDSLIFYGLSSSHLIEEASKIGLKAWHEVFADRTYNDDGSLCSRSKPNALIDDPKLAASQVLQIINEKTVTSVNGKKVNIQADTVCIHGDGSHAVEIARAISQVLSENKIVINNKQ